MTVTQITWLSFMLSRLAGQDTLTALSQTIPCARPILNSSNTLNNLGFYLGRSEQMCTCLPLFTTPTVLTNFWGNLKL